MISPRLLWLLLIPIAATAAVPIAATAAEPPFPTISFPNAIYTVSEKEGSAIIEIVREGDLSNASFVNWTAYAYSQSYGSGKAFFLVGQSVTTFKVTFGDDNFYTGDRLLTLTLSAPEQAVLGAKSATLRILEDDPAPTFQVDDVRMVAGEQSYPW